MASAMAPGASGDQIPLAMDQGRPPGGSWFPAVGGPSAPLPLRSSAGFLRRFGPWLYSTCLASSGHWNLQGVGQFPWELQLELQLVCVWWTVWVFAQTILMDSLRRWILLWRFICGALCRTQWSSSRLTARTLRLQQGSGVRIADLYITTAAGFGQAQRTTRSCVCAFPSLPLRCIRAPLAPLVATALAQVLSQWRGQARSDACMLLKLSAAPGCTRTACARTEG